MTPTTLYTPNPRCFAGQAVEYFRANPEEELTADDLATKFDVSRKNVHTLLRAATDAGWLLRDRNADGEYVYRPGPMLPAPALHPAPPTSSVATPTPAAAAPDKLAIAPDTPYSPELAVLLPVSNTRCFNGAPANKGQLKWAPLLERLTENGQSLLFPSAWRAALGSAIRKAHLRAGPQAQHIYRITAIDRTTACLWRLPK